MTHAVPPQGPAYSPPASFTEPLDLAPEEPVALTALVRSVVPLTEDQRERLQAHLERLAGQPVELQPRIDPSILGGVLVRMGDLVIDGSVRARLDALHEQLCAHCRLPQGAGPATDRVPA